MTGKVFKPTTGPADWKTFLADPDKHWKAGYSAMSAALCWEASPSEIPSGMQRDLKVTGVAALTDLELLMAVPEWKTPLPGGRRASQTDIMAIARNAHGLVVLGVEAKVDEPFGPTLAEKRRGASPGQSERIAYLEAELGLTSPLSGEVRYQLMHRTVAASLTAEDFHAPVACMVVQSFSESGAWRDDFNAFAHALAATSVADNAFEVHRSRGPRLFLVWSGSDARFRNASDREPHIRN